MMFQRGICPRIWPAAGPGYMVRTWPRSLGTIQLAGFSWRAGVGDLAAICRWAGLPSGRQLRAAGIPPRALGRLLALAAQNKNSNSYHSAGHFMLVILAAGLLANAAKITPAGSRKTKDHAALILAALVHDLDHHGRRASHQIYAQEEWSARLAGRVLARFGGDPRLAARIMGLLWATVITNLPDRKAVLAHDSLAALLTDADIFASVFFDRNRALTITRRLKLECRIEGQPEAILDGFVRHILKGKLSSPQGEF